MTKQKRHWRKYKSGRRKLVNPSNYGMFPLGKEKSLKVVWDKEKLAEIYEMEEMTGAKKTPEEIYLEASQGWKDEDKTEKEYISEKKRFGGVIVDEKTGKTKPISKDQLPSLGRVEANLIRGGFFDPETGEAVSSEQIRKTEMRKRRW